MKEISLDIEFTDRPWKDIQEDLGVLYNAGYRKIVIDVLSPSIFYEMLVEEAQNHGFWVMVRVTGGKKMRRFIKHAKPEEVAILRDKKRKMKALLIKRDYIKKETTWIYGRVKGWDE